MKKILAGLLLAGLVAMALPSVGLVQAGPPEPVEGCYVSDEIQNQYSDACGQCGNQYTADSAGPNCQAACCILTMVTWAGDWFFWIVLGIALIMLIYGAFMFVTAGGSEERAGTARKILIYAVIGIAIAYLARVIIAMVLSFTV